MAIRLTSSMASTHLFDFGGWSIQNCIAWTLEYLHQCHQSKRPLLILMLVYAKAFDTFEHDAILEILKFKGFDDRWLGWIGEILSLGSSSVLLNSVPRNNLFARDGFARWIISSFSLKDMMHFFSASASLKGGEGIQGVKMDQQEEEASVSVSSVPPEEEEEQDEEEEEQEEEEEDMGAVKMALGPQEEEGEEDDSLRRWKEQLLGPDAVHTTNLLLALGAETVEPEVAILNLTILAPGRPDLVLPIPFVPDDKGHAFTLKDGTAYSFRFSFTVSNNIVSGLNYSHTVWKTGVKVENQKVMLGTFSPQQEPYTYKAEEDSTPSGIFARGSYSARLKFVDDDGKVYLDMRDVDSLTRFACNEEGE
ncbi:rho GDP-dissociation inhibitor 1-like [Triticum dicoccoides]|uniref:rho GDP-dissociation inhibitor 1-like n=1 Tax=Triticum dicoccoides TaxID=85692 RepID=UPI00188F6215|nr:rho GDP-dissociation inhibitor 1-like [Triticum dicoccoides]